EVPLEEGRVAGEVDVGREGADEDEIEVGGLHAGRVERLARGVETEIGAARVARDEVALADARALLDPLVARVHQPREILVRDDARGDVAPHAEDTRVHHLVHRPFPQSRRTAPADDMPAPNARQQTRSPRPTRPSPRASASAIGIPAAATCPNA